MMPEAEIGVSSPGLLISNFPWIIHNMSLQWKELWASTYDPLICVILHDKWMNVLARRFVEDNFAWIMWV
jgi:hypothetical protein